MEKDSSTTLKRVIYNKKPTLSEWEDVIYLIFDSPPNDSNQTNNQNNIIPVFSTKDLPLEERIEFIRATLNKQSKQLNHLKANIRLVDMILCKNPNHLQQMLTKVKAKGGEGVILRKPGSKYIAGRTKEMLKVEVSI